MSMSSLAERFAERIDYDPNGGCWLWNGNRNHHGYGLLFISGSKMARAHRVSWELHRGPIPPKMNVLHHCDVTCCVNPDHLYVGDQRDNMLDRSRRGRAKTGHANTRLTAALVWEMRLSGEQDCVWARRLGMSSGAINSARAGLTWKSVAMPDQAPRRDFPKMRRMLASLANGPLTFRQIEREAGLERQSVYQLTLKARRKGRVEYADDPQTLRLTDAGRDFLR